MNLGKKQTSYPAPSIATGPKDKKRVVYPTFTIEKPSGNYKYGDTFSANVQLRVMNIEHGKAYEGSDPRHRCTLEVISMTPVKSPRKGLPS